MIYKAILISLVYILVMVSFSIGNDTFHQVIYFTGLTTYGVILYKIMRSLLW